MNRAVIGFVAACVLLAASLGLAVFAVVQNIDEEDRITRIERIVKPEKAPLRGRNGSRNASPEDASLQQGGGSQSPSQGQRPDPPSGGPPGIPGPPGPPGPPPGPPPAADPPGLLDPVCNLTPRLCEALGL